MNKIKNEKNFKCSICSIIIKNKRANFVRHLNLHKDQHERINCPLCEKTVQSKGNLKIHLKNIHNEDIGKFEPIQSTSSEAKSNFNLFYLF